MTGVPASPCGLGTSNKRKRTVSATCHFLYELIEFVQCHRVRDCVRHGLHGGTHVDHWTHVAKKVMLMSHCVPFCIARSEEENFCPRDLHAERKFMFL